MKTLEKAAWWAVIQCAMVGNVYAGFVVGIEGSRNLVQFAVWAVFLPMSFVALYGATLERDPSTERPPLIIRAANRIIEWSVLVVLLWSGHPFTGGAWAWWMLCTALARSPSAKQSNKPEGAPE